MTNLAKITLILQEKSGGIIRLMTWVNAIQSAFIHQLQIYQSGTPACIVDSKSIPV
jgi:hypothetical protein